jgi:tetratricopeptide (TPR) repeat protein
LELPFNRSHRKSEITKSPLSRVLSEILARKVTSHYLSVCNYLVLQGLETTFQILHGLSEIERDLLRHRLSYVPANNQGRENLLPKLAEFILSSKSVPRNSDCLEGVYGKGARGKKIINLKKRLLNSVLDQIISEPDIERNDALDPQDLGWIKSKKRLTQFYSFYYSHRGAVISLKLLEEAIALSKRFEHYLVLIECLRFKKWIKGIREGMRDFDSIQNEINHYERCRLLVEKAADAYYQQIIESNFNIKIKPEVKIARLKKTISELKRGNKVVQSRVASFYSKILEVDYHMMRNDYSQAATCCHQLVKIIHSSQAVYRRTRVSMAYCNLSRCELVLKQYDLAQAYARKGQENFAPGTANYSAAKEQEFYAFFHAGKWADALTICEELISASPNEQGKFRHARYHYFTACVLFKMGRIASALDELKRCGEITRDKVEWEVAIRLLNIMCRIEMNEDDKANLLIGALRKHIETYSKDPQVRQRHKQLIALLYQLSKDGFRFKEPNRSTQKLLNTLLHSKKPPSWSLTGAALLSFEQWTSDKFTSRNKRPRAV